MATKKFFGGGTTEYRCSRKNYEAIRRAARQATGRTDCEIDIRCLGNWIDINFHCGSAKAFEKSGDVFFDLLDRAKAEASLSGRKKKHKR